MQEGARICGSPLLQVPIHVEALGNAESMATIRYHEYYYLARGTIDQGLVDKDV